MEFFPLTINGFAWGGNFVPGGNHFCRLLPGMKCRVEEVLAGRIGKFCRLRAMGVAQKPGADAAFAASAPE
jgi:hypothetical protein